MTPFDFRKAPTDEKLQRMRMEISRLRAEYKEMERKKSALSTQQHKIAANVTLLLEMLEKKDFKGFIDYQAKHQGGAQKGM